MKISGLLRAQTPSRTVTKTEKTQSGKFQQVLTSMPQEPKDTITISGHAPTVEETPVSAAVSGADSAPNAAAEAVRSAAPQAASAASATRILPGDSIDVKLAKLRQMAEEADYTGMSYGEIYSAIWNRYNDAFDGNMPAITTFYTTHEWIDIHNQFIDECNLNVHYPIVREFEAETGIRITYWTEEWSEHERNVAIYSDYCRSKYGDFDAQAMGYGGMTPKETEQAICEKYAGKNTLRDFLNMQGELHQSGVLTSKLGEDGAWAYVEAINYQLPKTFFPDIYYDFSNYQPINVPQYRWDAVLDGRFDARAFAADMRETLKTMNFSGWDFDIEGAISQGIDYLLEAVSRAQQAEQERHIAWEKRTEQAELAERVE